MLNEHYNALTSDMRVKLGRFTQSLYSKQQRREHLHSLIVERSSRAYQLTNNYTELQRGTYEQQRQAVREQREQRRAQKKLELSQ
jgi:hypothetical protein